MTNIFFLDVDVQPSRVSGCRPSKMIKSIRIVNFGRVSFQLVKVEFDNLQPLGLRQAIKIFGVPVNNGDDLNAVIQTFFDSRDA